MSLLLSHWPVTVCSVTTFKPVSTVTKLTCTCLLLPHWHVHIATVTMLTCSCLLPHWPVYVCSVHVSTVLLPHWPVAVSTVTTLTCTCLYWPVSIYCYLPDLYYHHWSTHVCPVNTDLYLSLLLPHCTCMSRYHWHVHISTVAFFDLCMSLLLPLWHVLVPTVTTLIYTYLYCDHTDFLYLSTVTTLTCPSPYCYHTDMYLSPLLPLTCTCPLTWKWPVPVYCCHTDMCMSLLYHTNLFLSVTVLTCTCLLCACLYCFVTTLTCCSLYWYHTDLYLSLLTCLSLLLPPWPLLSPLICTCLSCYHWLVPVSTVTTLYMYVLLSLTCAYLYCCLFDLCMSLLLPLLHVLVPTVTTLIYTCLYCDHTDFLYLSTVTTLTCPSPYCYHIDMYLSPLLPLTCTCLLLPHWNVHVSTLPH